MIYTRFLMLECGAFSLGVNKAANPDAGFSQEKPHLTNLACEEWK
jgi:hypothetical protein